ncbi:hypothetical protein AB7C87_22475 [Natrarchaeobius sp. A-rgal3]|uniref:hypothetical protein n=1 Tax=Natrarchaeobius versutus TaxID=1679078 RepID=UPI00350F6379
MSDPYPDPPRTEWAGLPVLSDADDPSAFEDRWGSVLDEEGWKRLQSKVLEDGPLEARPDQGPFDGAKYHATDTNAVFQWDDLAETWRPLGGGTSADSVPGTNYLESVRAEKSNGVVYASPGDVQSAIDDVYEAAKEWEEDEDGEAYEEIGGMVKLYGDEVYSFTDLYVLENVTLDFNGATNVVHEDEDCVYVSEGSTVLEPRIAIEDTFTSNVWNINANVTGGFSGTRANRIVGGRTIGGDYYDPEGTCFHFYADSDTYDPDETLSDDATNRARIEFFEVIGHAISRFDTAIRIESTNGGSDEEEFAYINSNSFRGGTARHCRRFVEILGNSAANQNRFDIDVQPEIFREDDDDNPIDGTDVVWHTENGSRNIWTGQMWDFHATENGAWRIEEGTGSWNHIIARTRSIREDRIVRNAPEEDPTNFVWYPPREGQRFETFVDFDRTYYTDDAELRFELPYPMNFATNVRLEVRYRDDENGENNPLTLRFDADGVGDGDYWYTLEDEELNGHHERGADGIVLVEPTASSRYDWNNGVWTISNSSSSGEGSTIGVYGGGAASNQIEGRHLRKGGTSSTMTDTDGLELVLSASSAGSGDDVTIAAAVFMDRDRDDVLGELY